MTDIADTAEGALALAIERDEDLERLRDSPDPLERVVFLLWLEGRARKALPLLAEIGRRQTADHPFSEPASSFAEARRTRALLSERIERAVSDERLRISHGVSELKSVRCSDRVFRVDPADVLTIVNSKL